MTDDPSPTGSTADEMTETDAPTGKGPVRIVVPTWMSAVSVVVGVAFSAFAIYSRASFESDADYRLTL